MSTAPGVAIVTGGAQGLGASICTALLTQGYKVCIADIQETKGKTFVEQLQKIYGSEHVIFSCCDVTKETDYERTFDATLKSFEKIDIVVNNAGIINERDPRQTFNVNLLGPLLGCQTALKYMGKSNGGKGGIVINTSSISGFIPSSEKPAYNASKHGIIGLTRSYGLPYHLERDAIIFAALCPFCVDTDLLRTAGENTLIPETDYTTRSDLMSPDYVAQGVIKILEDRINGSALFVTEEGYSYIGYQDDFKHIPMD